MSFWYEKTNNRKDDFKHTGRGKRGNTHFSFNTETMNRI